MSGDKKENLEFFNTDRLAEGTRNKTWERIRITCSQPFRSAQSVRSKLQTAMAALNPDGEICRNCIIMSVKSEIIDCLKEVKAI